MSSLYPPPQESGHTNVPTAPIQKPRRYNRLPPAAVRILDDYIRTPGFWENNPTGMPNKSERQKLLANIKKLPGTEFYKMLNLTSWFKYRQPVENSEEASTSLSTPDQVHCITTYHSLSTTVITSLSTLCKDTPNPSPETIALWVKFLQHDTPGVTLEDVTRFVQDCCKPKATANKSETELGHRLDVGGSNIGSGLRTPETTESPTIAPSRPMLTTPDPFSVKTRHSRSPSLLSGRSTSMRSMPGSGSMTGSVSPLMQPQTPNKLRNMPRPLMDDMSVGRYTPAGARCVTPRGHHFASLSQSDVEPIPPQPHARAQSYASPSPMRVVAQTLNPNSTRGSTAPKSPPLALPVLDEAPQEDDMEVCAPPSSPPVTTQHAAPSSGGSAAAKSDSGIIGAILQGLASVRDNTAQVAPPVACPTNQTEFDAAFAWFDSTCQMIGDMLETRKMHER